MREIEIKMKVTDLSLLREKLESMGAQFVQPINQIDTTYLKGDGVKTTSLKEGDIILRIRRQDDKAVFNLKQQKSGEMDNLEFETDISEPDNMHKILLLMNWRVDMVVKKIRQKGKLADYEICLDQVEELGTFIEIEKICDDDVDPLKIREEIFSIFSQLGIPKEEEEIHGYDVQMYNLKNAI